MNQIDHNIHNWEDANAFLNKDRDPNYHTLHGKASFLRRESDNSISVVYHATEIVIYYPCGDVVIRNGGHQTVTTKRKINEYAPRGLYVWQKDYLWHIDDNGKTYDFYNGYTYHPKQESA